MINRLVHNEYDMCCDHWARHSFVTTYTPNTCTNRDYVVLKYDISWPNFTNFSATSQTDSAAFVEQPHIVATRDNAGTKWCPCNQCLLMLVQIMRDLRYYCMRNHKKLIIHRMIHWCEFDVFCIVSLTCPASKWCLRRIFKHCWQIKFGVHVYLGKCACIWHCTVFLHI